jgi:CRP-like cAMP-binding protein
MPISAAGRPSFERPQSKDSNPRPALAALISANRLLRSLDRADLEFLEPHMSAEFLERDEVIVEEHGMVARALFPCDCLLSAMVTIEGKRVETFAVGAEGGFGLLNALGAPRSPDRVIVQVQGWALTTAIDTLRARLAERPSLGILLARFAQTATAQAGLNVACNALHDTRQRLCRWLLTTADRIGSSVVPLTQEHLSIMLGVQRTTVTTLASDLQAQRIIRYSRGRLTLLDRPALEARSCSCYRLGKASLEAVSEETAVLSAQIAR